MVTDRRTDGQTDGQTDGREFIGPSPVQQEQVIMSGPTNLYKLI